MNGSCHQLHARFLAALLEHSPDAIVLVDSAGIVGIWNCSAERLFLVSATEAVGQPFAELISVEDRHPVFWAKESGSDQATALGDAPSLVPFRETKFVRRDGSELIAEVSGSSFLIENKSWRYWQIRDAEPGRQRESKLQRAATTDDLSQLLNRRGFQQQLEANLHRNLVVAILDVDWFKKINDQYGHETGDQAIQFVGRVLRDEFPQAVCLARLGGDEFGIVLVADANSDAATNVAASFEKLRTRFENEPFGHEQRGLTVSLGVVISSRPDVSARELLATADRALYQSKNSGRNRVSILAT